MSVPRSVAEVLDEHVTLEVEGIDRMYLNVYVPQLQREQGVASFFRFHRGHQFASSALMDPIRKTFVAALEAFARQEQVPVIQFGRVNAKMTSPPNTGRNSPGRRAWCLSARLRRRCQLSHRTSAERNNGRDVPVAGAFDSDG